MNIASREYKFLVPTVGYDAEALVETLSAEMKAEGLGKTGLKHKEDKRRLIHFLDTADHDLRSVHGQILRARTDEDGTEYTLKCRSADYFVSSQTALSARDGAEIKDKFEEDIAFPFRSRFSHSVGQPGDDAEALRDQPTTWYPSLASLELAPLTWMAGPFYEIVHVFKSARLAPDTDHETKLSTALIEWRTEPDGPIAIVEFSFRYKAADEGVPYPLPVIRQANRLFERLHRALGGTAGTKTAFAYQPRP